MSGNPAWKKGVSGNPGGRAADKPFRDMLLRVLAEDDWKKLRNLVLAVSRKAEKGDLGAIAIILDRLEGKVPQAIGGTDELPPIKQQAVGLEAARRIDHMLRNAGAEVAGDVGASEAGVSPVLAPDKVEPHDV